MPLPAQLAFIFGCLTSTRDVRASRRSVCVSLRSWLSPRLAEFLARAPGRSHQDRASGRSEGLASSSAWCAPPSGERSRSAGRRQSWSGRSRARALSAELSRGFNIFARDGYRPGPVPLNLLISTPFSLAKRRAFGENFASPWERSWSSVRGSPLRVADGPAARAGSDVMARPV